MIDALNISAVLWNYARLTFSERFDTLLRSLRKSPRGAGGQ